ncbi:hypothetical protein GS416_10125 [Rhodococcus hoagii]|nr:hypothetical protein [Prescottella equi]
MGSLSALDLLGFAFGSFVDLFVSENVSMSELNLSRPELTRTTANRNKRSLPSASRWELFGGGGGI